MGLDRGAILIGLSLLLAVLLPVTVQAQANACGDPAGDPPKVTCDGASYPTGIQYAGSGGTGIETGLELTVDSAVGDITTTADDTDGIYVFSSKTTAGTPAPITINVMGGTFKNTRSAIHIDQRDRAQGALTVTTAKEVKLGTPDSFLGLYGIRIWNRNSADAGAITVNNAADVYSDREAISVRNAGTGMISIVNTGDITVVDKDNRVSSGRRGIFINSENSAAQGISVESSGNIRINGDPVTVTGGFVASGIFVSVRSGRGNIPVTIDVTGGSIVSPGNGVWVNNAATGTTATSTVKVAGGVTINAGHTGVLVQHRGGGKADVVVDSDAQITGGKYGVYVDSPVEEAMQKVTVMGEVTGGVRLKGGGTVVVGPKAKVLRAASGLAVSAGDDKDLTIVLEKAADGSIGAIEGRIPNTGGTINFQGVEMDKMENVRTTGARGIFDNIEYSYQAKLVDMEGQGFEFQQAPGTQKITFTGDTTYAPRARVYEALPSVLLDLNGHHVRYRAAQQTVVTHDGDGGVGTWARVGGSDGKRRMDKATTSGDNQRKELAWDFSHYGIEAGVDIPVVDKPLLLGLSLHHRQGRAVVQDGGEIEASGSGVGVSAMLRNATGLYVDGRFSYTAFHDIDTKSSKRGTLDSEFTGTGYGVDVEGGKRIVVRGMEGVALTPRGGLSWSSVDIDDFDDLARIEGSSRVSVDSATSLKGRLGVLAEAGFGGTGMTHGRLFASLDVEHEFSSDRDVTASGTKLSSEAEATWGRFRLGGTMNWGWNDMVVALSGEGFYASAGDEDNHDFGGGVGFDVRF